MLKQVKQWSYPKKEHIELMADLDSQWKDVGQNFSFEPPGRSWWRTVALGDMPCRSPLRSSDAKAFHVLKERPARGARDFVVTILVQLGFD